MLEVATWIVAGGSIALVIATIAMGKAMRQIMRLEERQGQREDEARAKAAGEWLKQYLNARPKGGEPVDEWEELELAHSVWVLTEILERRPTWALCRRLVKQLQKRSDCLDSEARHILGC